MLSGINYDVWQEYISCTLSLKGTESWDKARENALHILVLSSPLTHGNNEWDAINEMNRGKQICTKKAIRRRQERRQKILAPSQPGQQMILRPRLRDERGMKRDHETKASHFRMSL